MPFGLRPTMIVTDSPIEKLAFPFLYELGISFINDGLHVHVITKNKIEDVPLKFDKSEDPPVDSLSRLSIKYLENTKQLVEYAIDLQFMLSRQGGKPPHAVLIQGLQNYFDNENYGDMALTLLKCALRDLSSAMNTDVYLIAAFEVSNRSSRITRKFLKNNFFKECYRIKIKERKGSIRRVDERRDERKHRKFRFKVENNVIFIKKEQFPKLF
ncbi:hypothetical protein LSTR_LSTR000028 [Laodelphax striatellus]|uniref:Uncharacterized protein n=1 Tax=Laodelphax striatellus TaxID=195883 RepID=A0A482X6B1_LAOST|nr:hypothetical protein LSTR_LSTR000028 [Laodelphax striatellus]